MKQQTKFKQTEIGKIPEDWEVDYLSNHLYIKGRIGWKGLQKSEYLKDGSGILIINGTQIQGDRMDWSKCERVPEWRYEESPEIQLKVNDIVMTKDGTIGKVAFVDYLPEKTSVASGIFVIRSISGKIDQKFLFHYFKSPIFRWLIETRKEGSVIPHLYQRDFENFPIVFPKDISEQRSIAKILSDLDAKIELNSQMNKTLEAIGQALFKKWFVDNPEREGWEVKTLADFIFVERGLSYKGSGLSEKGIPMINLGNIAKNNHFRDEGIKFYTGEYKEKNLIKPGDLIIANTDITQKREVLGSCLIVPSHLCNDKILFTHHIYAIRNKNPKNTLPKYFLSYLLQTPEYKERTKGFATGTTVLALPEDAILNFAFYCPDKKTLETFEKMASYLMFKVSENIIESKKLSQIRDSLLPKLMNGEIRVK